MMVIDSSVWVALYDESDSQHRKAIETGRSFSQVILTEYVILETSSLLLRKVGETASEQFLRFALDNSEVIILYSSQDFFKDVASLFRKLRNKKLSFVDVSLLYLSRMHKVITFDMALKKEIQRLK